jgi:hypothetical protein
MLLFPSHFFSVAGYTREIGGAAAGRGSRGSGALLREKRGGLVKASFFSSSVSSSSLLFGSASSPIDVVLGHHLHVPPTLPLSPPARDGGAPPPLQGPISAPEARCVGDMASVAQIVKF